MKRREIIKTLSAIPVAGGIMSVESLVSQGSQKKPVNDAGLLSNPPAGALALGPEIYQSIGVEPMINCRGTFTIISGSIELPEVQKAVDYAQGIMSILMNWQWQLVKGLLLSLELNGVWYPQAVQQV
jgi:hypothetical protein